MCLLQWRCTQYPGLLFSFFYLTNTVMETFQLWMKNCISTTLQNVKNCQVNKADFQLLGFILLCIALTTPIFFHLIMRLAIKLHFTLIKQSQSISFNIFLFYFKQTLITDLKTYHSIPLYLSASFFHLYPLLTVMELYQQNNMIPALRRCLSARSNNLP